MENLQTVSYTHLDVYKRQTPGRNGNYEQNDDAPAGDGAAASAGTSSASSQVINIINLDVYKRQGHIISVADTKGHVKGYIQNPGVDIKKTATGEVLVGPFMGQGQFVSIIDYGTGNPYTSSTPLISGEIGEDFAYYLTESEQTPSAVGLNVLLDEEDKVKAVSYTHLDVYKRQSKSRTTLVARPSSSSL